MLLADYFLKEIETHKKGQVRERAYNAAIRGMNAEIIQCDSLSRKAKRAFYVKNDSDNFLAFSDILEIPKTDDFAKFLNVEWDLDGGDSE